MKSFVVRKIASLALLVFILFFILHSVFMHRKEVPHDSQKISTSPVNNAWPTYTDQGGRFTIDYPFNKNLGPTDNGVGVGFINPMMKDKPLQSGARTITISFYENANELTEDEKPYRAFIKALTSLKIGEEKVIQTGVSSTINNETFKRLQNTRIDNELAFVFEDNRVAREENFTVKNKLLIVEKSDGILFIDCLYFEKEELRTFDKMLSTIKFLSPNRQYETANTRVIIRKGVKIIVSPKEGPIGTEVSVLIAGIPYLSGSYLQLVDAADNISEDVIDKQRENILTTGEKDIYLVKFKVPEIISTTTNIQTSTPTEIYTVTGKGYVRLDIGEHMDVPFTILR